MAHPRIGASHQHRSFIPANKGSTAACHRSLGGDSACLAHPFPRLKSRTFQNTASGCCLATKSCFFHLLIFLGFDAQPSNSYVRLSGLLKITFFGRRWTLIYPLNPYATLLHFLLSPHARSLCLLVPRQHLRRVRAGLLGYLHPPQHARNFFDARFIIQILDP